MTSSNKFEQQLPWQFFPAATVYHAATAPHPKR
jgi:hypothetical protein